MIIARHFSAGCGHDGHRSPVGTADMTLEEIDVLIEDTKRLARAADKVAQATALGVLEIARQLAILNQTLASQDRAKPAR